MSSFGFEELHLVFGDELCFSLRTQARYAVLLCAALLTAGCRDSGRVEIQGQVTRKDGSPLVGARVTFRSVATGTSAMGYTDSDGRYTLGTSRPGEGVMPGEYEVTVFEDLGPDLTPRPRTIHAGYLSTQTSGLKFTVDPSGPTTFDMVLLPP